MNAEASTPKGPIAWMAGHSVAANLLMLICLVGGLFSLRNITQEVFPDITFDRVTVTVPYPGASPEEVEKGIVLAIEEAVRGVDGVDEITSTAGEGVGSVTVEMTEGGDLQTLAQDIRSEVDRITTFPVDAEEPQITVLSRRRQVISLVLSGDADENVLREIGEQVRDRLLQEEHITQVDLSGVRPLEISIEIPQENLRRYNLTVSEVADRLRRSSVELPGGGIKTRGGEILVRMKERRDFGREFAKTPIISAPDGTRVLLGDIANVTDSFEDVDRYARYNGLPAIMVNVYRIGDQTPMQVSGAVRRQIETLNDILPPGIRADILTDRAEIYEQRVELLLRNGAIGLVLVLILLGIFLEIRLAFWVMMGIPISFLGSLLFLPVLDVSINMVTLFAYIIALGIVVDDAIVVGENVYYHRQQGLDYLSAAIAGAREVAMPVTFSILTNVVAFMPILFVPGTMGKIFAMIPVIVIITFLISLFESVYILPAHLGHQKAGRGMWLFSALYRMQQGFSRRFLGWVETVYGPFLRKVLRFRYITVAVGVSLLMIAIAYAMSGRLGFTLFPKVESDFARAEAVLPYGTAVERTEAVMRGMEAGVQKVLDEIGRPELVTGVYAFVGESGSHSLEMRVFLADPEIRKKIMGTNEFTRRWREAVGPIPGAEVLRFESDFGGPGRGAALTVELSHRSVEVLDQASAALAAELATFPLATDIDDGFQPGKEQIDFKITPMGRSMGLTASEVARQVRNAFYGAEVLRQQRGRNEIKVMVRLPKSQRISEHHLDELIIRTPAGMDIPLRDVATAERGRAYTAIQRRDGRRTVQVSADVTPRSKVGEVLNTLTAEVLPNLAQRFPGLTYGFEGKEADRAESMQSLGQGFAMAMLVIFALLAIPFRSYIQPLIVMFSIPFGIVGAVIGHMIMGYSLSVISMFGIVALSGVIVNDSLVMVEFGNRLKNDGRSAMEAITAAAVQRFRPIILTTLTTFFGLSPMILETSRQARFLIPMAISLGFGILFATGITLLLVPCLYLIVEDLINVTTEEADARVETGADVPLIGKAPVPRTEEVTEPVIPEHGQADNGRRKWLFRIK